MNGQMRRHEIVRDLARSIQFDLVIETGTYRGTSTEFLSTVFNAPITSIEADPRLFSYSSRRLVAWPDITVEFGEFASSTLSTPRLCPVPGIARSEQLYTASMVEVSSQPRTTFSVRSAIEIEIGSATLPDVFHRSEALPISHIGRNVAAKMLRNDDLISRHSVTAPALT
jgi:hypothetical protein